MGRDRYPKDPDRVRIVNDNFNTEAQEEAAKELLEHWPMGPTALADDDGPGQYSSNHYQKIRKDHLGPVEVDKTFGDLREEYGSVGDWLDQAYLPDEDSGRGAMAADGAARAADGTMIDELRGLSDVFDESELRLIRLGVDIGVAKERKRHERQRVEN